jgi:hypothetical protein
MVKSSGRKIRFRYAADAVRTRMYRNYSQLREGWTKNLALLFPRPGWRAAKTLLLWGAAWGVCFYSLSSLTGDRPWWLTAFMLAPMVLGMRLQKANFTWDMEVLGAIFGMPMFAYLLLRSKRAYARRDIHWKGRRYASDPGRAKPAAPKGAGQEHGVSASLKAMP